MYFEGNERLALFTPLSRIMRQGAPSSLRTTDLQRIIDALRTGDGGLGEEYFRLVHQLHIEMTQLLFEWCLEWPTAVVKFRSVEDQQACTDHAFRVWMDSSVSIKTNAEAIRTVDALAKILSPTHLKPGL